jgi:predicted TIM-barrel fold metal-dependent hydrolase
MAADEGLARTGFPRSAAKGPSMLDVHTHLHPPRLFAAIRRWFAERSSWRIDHPTEPSAVAAALRAAGVERFVFCSYAHKPGIARDLNAWLARTSRDLDGYGLPLATVHLDDPDAPGDLRCALDDGCIGLKIHEDVQALAVDDPRFDPIYRQLAEREGYVLAHVGPIPWRQDTREGPRRVAAVLARHPRLRFVVAHMGVPDTLAYFGLTADCPNLFVDTTMAFASPDLRTTAGAADIEAASAKIVYGSDFPNIPFDLAADRAAIRALGLSASAIHAIFEENARRLSPLLAG